MDPRHDSFEYFKRKTATQGVLIQQLKAELEETRSREWHLSFDAALCNCPPISKPDENTIFCTKCERRLPKEMFEEGDFFEWCAECIEKLEGCKAENRPTALSGACP